MSANGPSSIGRHFKSWHAEARKLRDEGFPLHAIARKFRVGATTVRCAIDDEYYARQLEINRNKRRRSAERLRAANAGQQAPEWAGKKITQTSKPDSAVVSAYADKPKAPAISLPVVSLPELPAEMYAKPQIRLSFVPRITVNEGAERIKAIHQRMMRRGLVSDRGVVEEFSR